MAFAAPMMPPATSQVRLNGGARMMSDWDAEAAQVAPPPPLDTATTQGVVVPTGAADDATSATPQEFVDAGAFGPPRFTKSTWNPQSLDVSMLPKFKEQFVPQYLKVTPEYLDGALPGDQGFDPWALTVLAKPTLSPDALTALDKESRTAAQRDEKMKDLSTEEQRTRLLWMRSSELKHGRLAMLAAAGWPLAEMLNGNFLRDGYTGGRAPSLFNGHLTDYAPFLIVFLGAFSALEYFTKDTVTDGDYGFDPLGFESGLSGAKRTLQTSEIKHGRAAMMGITGFAVQEFFYGSPVVEQTPFFFLPLGGFGR